MAEQFNSIIPIDLSQNTPQADPHVPSVADPRNYQPQPLPANYAATMPDEETKPMSGADIFSSLLEKANSKLPHYDNETPFNPKDAQRFTAIPYNPNVNNEDNYAKTQGVMSQIGNATAKFVVGSGVAFAETLMSIPDLLRASFGGNTYKNSWAQGLEDFQNNMENVFPNYYTDDERKHPFMSAIPFHSGFTNFFFDKLFKGSGLVVGTIAGAFVENAALAALTGGAGNVAAEGAIAEGAGTALTRAFGKMSLGFSKIATDATQFQRFMKEAKMTGEVLKNAQKMEELAAGVRLGNSLKYGLTLASSSNMMAAQGARETYKSIKEDLVNEYIRSNGDPGQDAMAEIDKIATAAANTKYGIDFALFTIQNAIAFPNAMKGFGAAKAGIKEGLTATTEGQIGKIGLANAEVKTAADIDNLILTPESAKARIVRKYIKPKNILTQAGVMGLSHGSGEFVKQYYTKTDLEHAGDAMASTLDGLKAAFGSEGGIESMLLGGLTGALIGPIEGKIAERAASKAGKLTPEAAAQTALTNLKKNSITGLFAQNYLAAADAFAHAREMKAAANEGDIFKYKNIQADQYMKMILTGIKNNRFEVVKEQLNMLKELPEAELDKVMATPTDSKATLQHKHDYIDTLMNEADRIKRDHDAISKVFLNKFDYRPNAKTEADKRINEMYLAYESVKDDMVGTSYTLRDRKARLESIDSKLREIHPDLTTDLVGKLCSIEGLEGLNKEYEQRSHELSVERDEMGNGKDEFSRERYEAIRKERGILNSHIDSIESFLEDIKNEKASLHDQADLFQQLASFEMNGRDIDAPEKLVDYTSLYGDDKGVGGVLDMGKDVVKLHGDIADTNLLAKYLYTEKGFRDWLMHKAFMNQINASIEKKKEEDNRPPVEYNGKKYEVGRSYELQKGMDMPTVEEGTQKGVQKFFTKDFWGGVGAKLSFKTKEEAEEAAAKNKENFEKELKTVTIVGTEIDQNGNIKVKTASGRIENIDPALLENHIPTELPEEIVNSQKRYDINKELKQHMEAVELQNPYYMSIENFEDIKDPDTVAAMLKDADIEARGRLKRSPFVYGATIQPPNGRPYVENAQVFFSNFDQISKVVKQRKGQLKMIFVHSDNAQALGLGEIWSRPDGTKGSVIDFTNHGTSAVEVNKAGDVRAYETKRGLLQAELDKLADTPENKERRDEIQKELAHAKYMIDNSHKLKSYNQNDVNQRTILTVAIEKTADGWHYINSKGERLSEVNSPEDLVINTMPVGMEGGVMTGDKRHQGDVSREEELDMLKAWRAKRDEIFANTSSEPPMYSYDVSRGFPKRVPDPDNPGKWKQFPVTKSLVEKADLHELGLVGVVTEKGVSYMGGNLAAPNGSLVIRKDKLLQFLNNRKLTTNEVDSIFEILKDFAKTIDDVRSISYNTKDEVEQKKREGFKSKLNDITNYLQGAVYYGRDNAANASEEKVNKGQLYIGGANIYIGRDKNVAVKIPFTPEAFDPNNPYNRIDQLKEALATLNTNASSIRCSENKPFKELYVERGENGQASIKSRIWKSYQHFLMSDTIDLSDSDKNYEQDGKMQRATESIPFTTSVAPREEGKSNFIGQYAALKKTENDESLFEHVVKKAKPEIKGKEEKAPEATKAPQTPIKTSLGEQKRWSHPMAMAMFGGDIDYKWNGVTVTIHPESLKTAFDYALNSPASEMIKASLVEDGFLEASKIGDVEAVKAALKTRLEGIIKDGEKAPVPESATGSITDKEVEKKTEESKPEEPKPQTPPKRKPRARMMNPEEVNYRVHDLEKSEAWLKANIPVPGKRVYNILKATGGGFAWGEYCDTHVKYYVAAKRGTIEHEAFESIWWSFTSAEERSSLMKEFRSREGAFIHHEDWRNINYKDASDYEIKEQLAEEFGRYVLDGKLPPAPPKKKSSNFVVRLFQHMVDFVKGIFDGSIKSYFDKINTGYYKTAPRLNDFRGLENMDKYSKTNIGPLNITDTHAVTRGVTSRIIQHLFADSKTLIEFDTRHFKAKNLLDKVFEDIKSTFVNDPNSEWGIDPNSIESLYHSGQIEKEQFEQHMRLWNTIQMHWASEIEAKIPEEERKGSIIDNVYDYLRLFGIRHDVDESGTNEDRPNYQFKDVFEVDNDKTMSASMKLLFATIVEQVKDPVSGEIVEKIDPATNMPIPVNFSKLTGFVREALTDCNTFGDKMARLSEMAKTDPNVAKILERLKIDPETGMTMQGVEVGLDDLKLRAAFNNTFGKQRPDAIAMYVHEDGNTIFSAQNLNSSTTKQVSDWVDSLKLTLGEPNSPFVVGEGDVYTFDGSKFAQEGVKGKLDTEKQVAFLKSLGIDFNEDLIAKLSTEKMPGHARSDRDEFVDSVRALYTYLPKVKDVNVIKAGDLGAAGRLRTIAELYLKALGFEESIFFNIENRQQSQDVGHNFISTSINDINSAESRQDLNSKLRHMVQPFRADSWYLNHYLFEGNARLKDRSLALTYIQGIINEKAGEYNETLASMAHPQRVLAEIKANLNQLYYVLVPADSKTEWALKMQHIVKWDAMHDSGAAELIYNKFKDYYLTEKALSEGNPNYKSLMYDINGGYEAAALDKKKLTDYIESRVNTLFDYLLKTGGITRAEGEKNVFNVKNFPTTFAKEAGINIKKGTASFSEAGLKNLFRFTEVNYMLNNIEIHKLFFGDVAHIKDPLKRYKSFMSPRETSMHDDPEFNRTLNNNLNKAADTGKDLKLDPNMQEDVFVKRSVQLTNNDYGHWNYSDEIKTLTTRDQMVYESAIANDERLHRGSPEARAILQDAYKHVNPTDGSGTVVLMAHREMMYKRGQITKAHDKMYDYLLALDRQLMHQDGHLQTEDASKKNYYRPELQAADERIVKRGYGHHPEDTATLDVLKPIYSGMDNSGNLILDKYSLAPLTYALVRKGPLEKMYLKMVDEKIHYAVQDSGRKIGAQDFYDVYKEDGSINSDDFKAEQQRSLNFKYFGIQTETGGRHDHNSFGTQMSTEFALNTIDRGVPADYDGKSGEWEALSHAEKMKYQRYRQIQHVYDVTTAMQEHGYGELLKKFGITEDPENERFYIPTEHMPKVEKLLREELLRRDVSQNLKDGLTWDKEKGEWAIPLEAMANYKQIKQILFSYVDKFIAKPKQSGGAKIMVPGVLLGNIGGKDIKVIRGKKGNEVRYVSDGLKFYEAKYDANGKRTSVARMEVMITSDLPKQMRKHDRWKNATDQEIMEHLNSGEGKKLLEGIGFRIPTQEMNSLEAFVIKGFLPDYLGDTVVVPEAITTKAGSDFDVDKLQTYVKNAYLDKEGNVHMVPFLGMGEGALESFKTLAKDILGKSRNKTTDEAAMEGVEMDTPEELTDDDFDRIFGDDEAVENLANKLYKQSLQNEYYDSLGEAILHPDNYERLVKPNSADMMKGISKRLEEIAPSEFTADKKGSVIDRMFMSQARHAFITGKDGVAVAANNQKSHSIMQLAKVVVEPRFLSKLTALEQQFVGNGSILLPHNKAKVFYDYENINGKLMKVSYEQGRWLPTISGTHDDLGQLISDNLSQGIDGYVDVAKGAWIMNIIQDPMTSSTFFTMLRLGINPTTAAFFINQPIVREYIKILARDGQSFMTKRPDSKERREIFNMFPVEGISTKDKEFNKLMINAISKRNKEGIEADGLNEKLTENIRLFYNPNWGDVTDVKDGAIVENEAVKKFGVLGSSEANIEQHMILQEFLKYKVLSDNLFSMQEALTWDTKSMAEPNMQVRKRKLVDKARTSNIFSDIDDIFEATHLGALMDNVVFMSDAIGQSMFNTGVDNVRRYIRQVLDFLPSRMSGDHYQIAAQGVEENFISFLVQNMDVNEISNPVFSEKDRSEEPINTRIKELLVDRKTSTAKRLKDLRKAISEEPNSDLARNEFLRRLAVKTRKNIAEVKNLFLASKPADPTSSDVITNTMRELRASSINLTHNDIYNDILITAFLQSGMSNSAIAFNKYIPAEDFARIVKPAIQNLMNNTHLMEAYVRTDSFFRNKWKDDRIVPQLKEAWSRNDDNMLDENSKSRFRLSKTFNSAWSKFRENPEAPWAHEYSNYLHEGEKKARALHKYYQPFKIPVDSKEAQFDFVHMVSEDFVASQANDISRLQGGPDVDYTKHFLLKKVRGIDGRPIEIEGGYVYMPISTLGDGMLAQEHYTGENGVHSVLKTDGMQIPYEIGHNEIAEFISNYQYEQQDKADQERSRQQSGLAPSVPVLDESEKSRIFAEQQAQAKLAEAKARNMEANRDLKKLFYKFDVGTLGEYGIVERSDTTGAYYVDDSRVNEDNTITLQLLGKQEGSKTHWVTIDMEGYIKKVKGSSGREIEVDPQDAGKVIFPGDIDMKMAQILDRLKNGTKEETPPPGHDGSWTKEEMDAHAAANPPKLDYDALPEKFTKAGKTQEYKTEEGNTVQGYKLGFEGHPNVNFFIHKVSEGYWQVRQEGTGIKLGDGGRTIKEAVKSVTDIINSLRQHPQFMEALGINKKTDPEDGTYDAC